MQPGPDAAPARIPRLLVDYYARDPDPGDARQRVAFGTSGHRGTSSAGSFNEPHIASICTAIVEMRRERGIDGPLFLGMDTHALSEAAHATAVEVFAGNDVELRVHPTLGYTPTPVISHAILAWNRGSASELADGVVITPSHNPPEDGGFKYNPPTGGPADTDVTRAIEARANRLLETGAAAKRLPLAKALAAETTRAHDAWSAYVADLGTVVDLEAIRAAGLNIGTDPMGGSALEAWDRIAETHGVIVQVVNRTIDPSFSFMPPDHDGRIRMDCSSPHAMAGLVGLKDAYDVAFGNDPDADRHGIVTPSGLMNPNHFLAVCVDYLFRTRTGWTADVSVGKTLVSSALIDRVAAAAGRALVEVPVGFKWFVDGLLAGRLGFAGEESAGASLLRRDGSVWTTDKDGIVLDLLAAEITAATGRDPSAHHRALVERFGESHYTRIDAPATPEQKALLSRLTPEMVTAGALAGDPITAKLTTAPGNGAPIGGLKVVTDHGWFAARPSGTENIYKIYAESFRGERHLSDIVDEAKQIVGRALAAG
jgi:phosphoglucomutase